MLIVVLNILNNFLMLCKEFKLCWDIKGFWLWYSLFYLIIYVGFVFEKEENCLFVIGFCLKRIFNGFDLFWYFFLWVKFLIVR